MMDIVIQGEAIIAICFIVGLMLGWYHAHKKAFGVDEEQTQDNRWWIEDPSPCGIEAGTPDTIACEGCGRHPPLHIWEMLGNNCFYGTCVGGRWLLEDWMQLYEDAVDAYSNPRFDNEFVLDRLDEIQVRNFEINHQQYLED